MHYIISYSGGVTSWAAAKLTQDAMEPEDKITLLFADTLIEDEDTYRFLYEGADVLGLTVTRLADGRTPFEVFRDEGILGNSRVDPCSRVLKRELLDKWISEQTPPYTSVVGLDWMEIARFDRFAARKSYPVSAPLIDAGLTKIDAHNMATEAGIRTQRLYELGFPHANCGGGCVKAGQSSFAHFYRTMPERFAMWEKEEEAYRQQYDLDISFLRERKNKTSTPLTLKTLRERIESQGELLPILEEEEWGGCGCAIDE